MATRVTRVASAAGTAVGAIALTLAALMLIAGYSLAIEAAGGPLLLGAAAFLMGLSGWQCADGADAHREMVQQSEAIKAQEIKRVMDARNAPCASR